MTKRILFVIASIILLIIVYVSSLTGIIVERQSVALDQMLLEAKETGDFTSYLKFSTELHLSLNQTTNQSNSAYDFDAFQTVEHGESGLYSSLIVFIRPIDTVTFAETTDDTLDATSFVVKKDQTVLYDSRTDEIYDDFAISYGIGERGFYYYNFIPEIGGVFNILITDYNGQIILDSTIDFVLHDFSFDASNDTLKEAKLNELIDDGYVDNYTIDEIAVLYDFESHQWKAYMYAAIFLVIDVLFGYFFIFKKK